MYLDRMLTVMAFVVIFLFVIHLMILAEKKVFGTERVLDFFGRSDQPKPVNPKVTIIVFGAILIFTALLLMYQFACDYQCRDSIHKS